MAAIDPPAKDEDYPDPDRFGPLPASGFFIRHARNLDLSHVEIRARAADARPAFWLKHVEGFDGSYLKMPAGADAFRLEHVTGFRSSATRDLPDRRIDTVGMVRF